MSGLNIGFRIEDGVLIDGEDRIPASVYEESLWELYQERLRVNVGLITENKQLRQQNEMLKRELAAFRAAKEER